jgi:hypothetical protein
MTRLQRLVTVVALAMAEPVWADDGPPRVTCGVPGDPDARSWRLAQVNGRWQISFSRRTLARPIQLALPGAKPEIANDRLRLAYKNANGGRQVTMSAGGGPSVLDIWVDHGLEVNIEPDLDPRVDDMNTQGPLQNVQCTIGSGP